jgi:hypothetical protein
MALLEHLFHPFLAQVCSDPTPARSLPPNDCQFVSQTPQLVDDLSALRSAYINLCLLVMPLGGRASKSFLSTFLVCCSNKLATHRIGGEKFVVYIP